MNRPTFLRTLGLALACLLLLPAFAAEKKTASPRFPLRGVITRVEPDGPSLMVKHEEIPGVMRAMTMRFKVAPEVVQKFKVGDAITALMSRVDDEWRLDQVKAAPAAPKK